MRERYGITLVTPPASEPVTTAEAKLWLRVEHSADDDLIAELVTAARQKVEQQTGLAMITQTWRMSLDEFPCWEIELPRSPLQSVSSVTYVDHDGVTQTVSASDYAVDASIRPGTVEPAYGEAWPSARCQPNSVQVTFVAGYGSASAVPAPIKAAIKLTVASLYENRGEASADLPPAAAALVAPFLDGRYP